MAELTTAEQALPRWVLCAAVGAGLALGLVSFLAAVLVSPLLANWLQIPPSAAAGRQPDGAVALPAPGDGWGAARCSSLAAWAWSR